MNKNVLVHISKMQHNTLLYSVLSRFSTQFSSQFSTWFPTRFSSWFSTQISTRFSPQFSTRFSSRFSTRFSTQWHSTVALQPNFYLDMQIGHKLWLCCCKELQNNLQYVGITPPSAEGEIIDKVKDLAVKITNTLLNLCKFLKMAQKEDEGIRQYVARLKGAADLCDFTVGSGMDTISYVD